MKRIRAAGQAMVVALLLFPNYHAAAQNPMSGVPMPARVIFLTRADNGGHVKATVGQIIQIDLQSLPTAEYGTPKISSPSVEYENSVLPMPQTPAGQVPILIFKAVSTGEAEIRIPRGESPGFSITVEVRSALTNSDFDILPDQSFTDDSRAGSTNLVNHTVQTFTPAVSKLANVEVKLVGINSTPDHAVTLTLLNTNGQPMAIAEKPLVDGDPGWVSFLFANGGVDVTPGEVYGIEVSGGNRFGWKYAESGYRKGEALFNGRPILKGAHASFLFKTFGSKLEVKAPLEPRP